MPPALAALSGPELEVLRHIARGRSNREIADELVLSVATVKTHLASVLAKLGLRDRVQARRASWCRATDGREINRP